ncbi:MAG: ribonuclease Z [Sphingobacteriales bacterium]|jgi:ribonuclease Z
MRPLLHPSLVNGRTGDPVLYIETLFERRAILFDLGDLSSLPARKLQRVEHVFVSHAHIDHFIGFDRLLRVLVGRKKTLKLYGPNGFIEHVHHKLQAYRWNLVDRYLSDLVLEVTEVAASLDAHKAQFRLKRAFALEDLVSARLVSGALCDDPSFRVVTAVLEHRTPCLAFAIEEPAHVNVWKNRLEELGLPIGPWLRKLKRAVLENRSDYELIEVGATPSTHKMPLGALRKAITVTPGQKVAYVTDAADTPANRDTIIALAHRADLLFIEAAFAKADAQLAAERAHLTTDVAGRLARAAGVRRVEPFHFSPRYSGQEARMLNEVTAAFVRESEFEAADP